MQKLIAINTIFLVVLLCAGAASCSSSSGCIDISVKIVPLFSLELAESIDIAVANITANQRTAAALLRFKTNRPKPWNVQVYSIPESRDEDEYVELKKIDKTIYKTHFFEAGDSEIEVDLDIPLDNREKDRDIIIMYTITE